MESFSLTMEGETVIVRGHKRRDQSDNNLSQRPFWQLFRSNRTSEVDEWETVELRYTPEQLSHMDHEGRSKRANLGSPDAHSASQIVRAVGALVDQRQARLISFRKDAEKIRIEYEPPLKGTITEDFTVATLYEYWVRMYLKRSNRLEQSR